MAPNDLSSVDSVADNYATVPLEESIHSTSVAELKSAIADSSFSEDLALALLKRNDLPPEVLEQLGKHNQAIRSRKVRLALVAHPRTPRHISMALVRQLFTFDLMGVALTPAVAGDIKMAAEEALIKRAETISTGERLALARRASGRVAGMLLRDPELRVVRAALENPRLTEVFVVRNLLREGAPANFAQAVCRHPKWSLRRDVRIALLRTESTPLARALEFARSLPATVVKEALENSRLPQNVKSCLLRVV